MRVPHVGLRCFSSLLGAWKAIAGEAESMEEKVFLNVVGPMCHGMREVPLPVASSLAPYPHLCCVRQGGRATALHYLKTQDSDGDGKISRPEFDHFIDALRTHPKYRKDDMVSNPEQLSKMRPPRNAPKGGSWALSDGTFGFFRELQYTDPDGYTWDESGTCTTAGYQYDMDMSAN